MKKFLTLLLFGWVACQFAAAAATSVDNWATKVCLRSTGSDAFCGTRR